MNAIIRSFRVFYRQDVRPFAVTIRDDLRKAYIGPNWSSINGYEKVGRAVCGTAHLIIWVLLLALWAALWLGVCGLIIEGVVWLVRLVI